jgi:hypothetical protein
MPKPWMGKGGGRKRGRTAGRPNPESGLENWSLALVLITSNLFAKDFSKNFFNIGRSYEVNCPS